MFGISTRRMAVRAAIPWYWRWLGLLVLALAVVVLSRLAYDFRDKFDGLTLDGSGREVQRSSVDDTKLQQELELLRGRLTQSERQLQMDRAAYADVVKQVKALADENAGLKEDLAFFQTLMPSGSKEGGGVAINRFLVQNDALPGEYRYRLLLTQTGQRAKDFQGSLQFVVSLQQDNKKVLMSLPAEDDDSKTYRLNFRFYQRIEGTFRVAPNAVVKSMQVRVFESGNSEPRLTQTANAS